MRSRKRRDIYAELADKFKTDKVLIRKVAHHPFEFVHKKMTDEYDHRPIRLRYFGLFFVKGPWRKQMIKSLDEAPPEGVRLFARVRFEKKGNNHYYLHKGIIKEGNFISDRGDIKPMEDISYWKLMRPEDEE